MFFVSYFGEKAIYCGKVHQWYMGCYGGEMFLPFVISKTSIGYVSFQVKPFMGTWYGYIIGNFQAYLGNGAGIIDSTIPPLLNLEFFNSGKRSLLPILRFNHR